MKIKQLHEKAILPRYGTEGASAFDLFCHEDVEWKNRGGVWHAEVYTGWAFEVEREHGMFLLSRSGHGRNHLTHLSNCVGLLDFDYRGEAIILLMCHLSLPPVIKAKTAIAQACIIETPKVFFEVVNELTKTVRGDGGFGSTDKEK